MTLLPDIPDDFEPTSLDLVLALVAAIGLPLAAGYLFSITGALVPLVLYYGVFCWAIVKWRRGSVGYEIHRGELSKQFSNYLSKIFATVLLLQLILVWIEWITVQTVPDSNLFGFLITLLVWAPINAFSEQLIWMYTFDSYAEYFKEGRRRTGMIIIGGMLYVVLIAMIHALFWGLFLNQGESIVPFTQIFIVIQMAIALGYIILYRTSRSMWPLGLIHILINLAAVGFSGYSILPYLLIL